MTRRRPGNVGPSTKVHRADEQLQVAEAALGKALSLLGGPVRRKPKDPTHPKVLTRQLIETIVTRMAITRLTIAGAK